MSKRVVVSILAAGSVVLFEARTSAGSTLPPKKLAVFYGFPSLVNGSAGDLAAATDVFGDYDTVVFGRGLEDPGHPDHANTAAIIGLLKTPPNDTRVYGDIPIGEAPFSGLPAPLTMQEIKDRIDAWDAAGAAGVHLNEAGYDFGVSRQRQNEAVAYAHALGLSVFINAFHPEDVFSPAVDPVFNPTGDATLLGPDDIYLLESFQIILAGFQDPAFWVAKADAALNYKQTFGTQMATVTTVSPSEPGFAPAKFDYAWWSTLLYGFDYMGWGELYFSASDSMLPFRARPRPGLLGSFASPVVHAASKHERATTAGVIQVDTDAHTGRFAGRSQTLWVFSDEVTTATQRQVLVERSAASGVDVLYLSVYRSTPNSAGRLMYEDAQLADLVMQAHNAGIQVWAAYGAPDWAALGCAATAFPRARMDEIVAYNLANPAARLDGVMLDVEPAEPQSEGDFQSLLALYECIRDALTPEGLQTGVAIRFFWEAPVTYPPAVGSVKEAYKHVIDMDLDSVVVMGYRDTAGMACPDDGIVCLDQDEVAYADSVGRLNLVLAGVETQNCAPGCGPEKVTFFEGKVGSLNLETLAVVQHFNARPSFGGLALHRYGDSYLAGVSGWPLVNGGSSTETNTLVGMEVEVQPIDAATGGTPATFIFSNVGQAGSTVVATSTSGAPPPAGLKLAGTYFEIATSAGFTGPIEVCITYGDTDYTGAEGDLRLFHFEDTTVPPDGVRESWVDHTTSHDANADVICATMDSLSPFAILEPANSPPTVACSGGGTLQAGDVAFLGGEVADVDGDAVAYQWSEGDVVFGSGQVEPSPTGEPAVIPETTLSTGYQGTLGLGLHVITLLVADQVAGSAECEVTVEVVDTEAPMVTAVASPGILWPPDHTMRNIVVDVMAFDASGGPVTLSATVTSSEPASTVDFTQPVIDQATGILTLQLRAERSGNGPGRTYTIAVTAADASGNSSSSSATVVVAHDRRNK